MLSSCDLRAHWYRVAQSIALRDGVEVFDIVMEVARLIGAVAQNSLVVSQSIGTRDLRPRRMVAIMMLNCFDIELHSDQRGDSHNEDIRGN